MNRLIIALLGSVLYSGASMAQKQTYFTNPVIHGDVADPSILRIDDTYYATGTSSEWAPYYPVFTSKDLVNWKQTGHVFEQQPEWTKSSFWAPEWYYHNGKVYVYYTARKKSNNTSYIGVATSDSPTGKFKDHGPVVESGTEAIDAFILEDKGDLYISLRTGQPADRTSRQQVDSGRVEIDRQAVQPAPRRRTCGDGRTALVQKERLLLSDLCD